MLILVSAFLARKLSPVIHHTILSYPMFVLDRHWSRVLQGYKDETSQLGIIREDWVGNGSWYPVSGLIWSLIYHKSILSSITQIILMIFRKSSPVHSSSVQLPRPLHSTPLSSPLLSSPLIVQPRQGSKWIDRRGDSEWSDKKKSRIIKT